MEKIFPSRITDPEEKKGTKYGNVLLQSIFLMVLLNGFQLKHFRPVQ